MWLLSQLDSSWRIVGQRVHKSRPSRRAESGAVLRVSRPTPQLANVTHASMMVTTVVRVEVQERLWNAFGTLRADAGRCYGADNPMQANGN
jgi:hypothetical protein